MDGVTGRLGTKLGGCVGGEWWNTAVVLSVCLFASFFFTARRKAVINTAGC